MAQPSTNISRTMQAVTVYLGAWETLQGCLAEYNALGGDSAVAPFFSANPSFPITKAQFEAIMTSISNVQTLMNAGNGTNLYTGKA